MSMMPGEKLDNSGKGPTIEKRNNVKVGSSTGRPNHIWKIPTHRRSAVAADLKDYVSALKHLLKSFHIVTKVFLASKYP